MQQNSSDPIKDPVLRKQFDSDNPVVLTNRVPVLVIAGVFWLIGIATSLEHLSSHKHGRSLLDMLIPLLLCTCFAIVIYVGIAGERTIASNAGISRYDFWRLSWSFRWEDVRRIDFKTGRCSGLWFETVTGEKHVLGLGGSAWPDFLRYCLRNLPDSVKMSSSEAIARIEKTI